MASQRICTQCGSVGRTKTVTKGSIFIELILWLCLLVPGVIYSLWRLTTRHEACGKCGSSTLVPVDSPHGQMMIGGSVASPDTHVKCPDCRELVLKEARKCKHCGIGLIPQA